MKEQEQAKNVIHFMKISFISLIISSIIFSIIKDLSIPKEIINFFKFCLQASSILCLLCILFLIFGIIVLIRSNKKDGSSNNH